MGKIQIEVPRERIAEFCGKWSIREFSFFGSVVRDDFGPESDIDVLVTFASEARHTLFDLVDMEGELRALFGRDVDLVSRRGIESSRNPLRKAAILESAEAVYAA